MPHAQPTLGTIADYFRFGIEVGLLTPENARAWADSVIMKLDSLLRVIPPFLSSHKSRGQAL